MTRKQRRLTMIGGSLVVLAVAAALVLNAMRDSIVFFNYADRGGRKTDAGGNRFRLGGLVQPGTLVRGDDLAVTFDVADGKNSCASPTREFCPTCSAKGRASWPRARSMRPVSSSADTVLAKHDETYMPKEVADALKKQGHWKDDYGAKPSQAGAADASRAPCREPRSDRRDRTLRAGAGARARADPGDGADCRRALNDRRPDECRALDRAGAIAVRGAVVRAADRAAT